ncbi:MAG TPA: YhjD/YihY/BrkB family envelope integrity protein, partial [Alphaproteobacteria bacterium]
MLLFAQKLLFKVPGMSFIWATVKRVLDDNVSFLAGGVAFYGLLSIFPAMAAVVSIYGLLVTGYDVQQHLSLVERFMPHDAFLLLQDQLVNISKQNDKALSLTVILSLLFTLYAATKGTKA